MHLCLGIRRKDAFARRLGRLTPLAYPWLATLPPLCTHYLGWLTKPDAPAHSQEAADAR